MHRVAGHRDDPRAFGVPALPVGANPPRTGADSTTNLSVFSVGRSNAVDQTLFRSGTVYDGYADIALLTIATTDGRFGSVHTGNASYFHATGKAGIYAPGVQFTGPVYVQDIAKREQLGLKSRARFSE